ncbi:MAG: hypothetical protein J0H12_01885 [Candidatus Paracaedimonas acanthamoebae]|uniref:HEXXH motif domain-containing protein n=1 Tax=Candidatus Paracaedimonas acanthamoebae TaxID=244581 RepID=A0A8J7PX75_9PROT|nr:hypothetical protein [Candidatus Paracaedimonas acanthamoebae]
MIHLFEAQPCEKRALLLRTRLNKALISSLIHLLEAAEEVLSAEVYQLSMRNLNSLNSEKKISGFLHALNAALSQAFTHEDIPTIKKIAQHISENDFQVEGINFLWVNTLPPYFSELFQEASNFEIPGGLTFTPSSLEGHQRIKSLFQQGLNLISQSCEDLYKEISVFLGEILTFNTSRTTRYGSSFNLLGLIYISESSPFESLADVVDAFAHETGHLYLHSLSAEDPLVLNSPEERYPAPFREDKRPLIGIYHASFVGSRILYALRALYRSKLLPENEQIRCATLIEYYQVKYTSSLETVQKHGKMTTLGQNILNSSLKLAS